MGLLKPSDWNAAWISDAVLADPANRPRTPTHCYRSEIASSADTTKWIVIDLGSSQKIDAVNLMPARPAGLNHDIMTVGFPRRFKIELANNADFSSSKTPIDHSRDDVESPRSADHAFQIETTIARYVRLTVTRLDCWDANEYALFLGQIQVMSGKRNIAVNAAVTCSDSLETDQWSKRYLVDGHPAVKFCELPAPLVIKLNDATSPSRVPLLRKEFQIDSPIRRATLYVTSRGFHEMRINGQRVGDQLLAPGFTAFEKRISYQTHDVTSLIHQGPNAIGAMLGYGWYAGHMNLSNNEYIYGFFPQLLAQLEIELADGRHVTINTDNTWKTTIDGSLLWSDLLDGEACDLTHEIVGWDQPGFAADKWKPAWQQPRDAVVLSAQRAQPVRAVELIQPTSSKAISPGVYVFDMGEEFAGWCRIKTDGPAGTHLTLLHAEAIHADGTLDRRSLWAAAQRDDYVLDGKGPRILEPHFTYHGFRYVQVSGLTQPPGPDTLVGVRLRTDTGETGKFECSNELFNRIMAASRCTQENMLFDIPAGCAARSERLGWTGDIRPCVNSALLSFDTHAFFDKFLIDLRDQQYADGRFTDITPQAHLRGTNVAVGSPGWGDAGVTLPWDLYVQTADVQALADHFDAACRWVDQIDKQNPDHLWINGRGQDWGDWLSAGTPTPKDIGSTAFFAHDADIVSKMATVLGRTEAAAHYAEILKAVRGAFAEKYVSADGRIASEKSPDTQGSYARSVKIRSAR